MSLRNIKKLQSPDMFHHTDDSEESEAAPRKAANNFELVISVKLCNFNFHCESSSIGGGKTVFDDISLIL